MVISFENQGPTIPAEKLSMIFERFYRMDEARSSDAGFHNRFLRYCRR